MTHKAGFVNIIGKPNAGKSTLMNTLVGERLAIVTQKTQTTRHRILGIVNTEDHQIIFSDTPGIFDPAYKLQESMMNSIRDTFQDADVFLIIQEVRDKNLDENLINKIEATGKPVILILNKIDLENQEKVKQNFELWKSRFSNAEIIPASALHNFNIDTINDKIQELLPESPAYYDKDSLTDRPLRFFVSEIIREKILLQYRKEIPYSVEVVIEEYKDTGELVRIRATIYVERESQRKILIGKEGNAIKGLGIDARQDIEKFIDQKIFLDLSVKVSKDWRDDDKKLKQFGYPLT